MHLTKQLECVQSYFALLKRRVHGTLDHMSKQHLFRYCDEFTLRWNHRKMSDGARATQAIKGKVKGLYIGKQQRRANG